VAYYVDTVIVCKANSFCHANSPIEPRLGV